MVWYSVSSYLVFAVYRPVVMWRFVVFIVGLLLVAAVIYDWQQPPFVILLVGLGFMSYSVYGGKSK